MLADLNITWVVQGWVSTQRKHKLNQPFPQKQAHAQFTASRFVRLGDSSRSAMSRLAGEFTQTLRGEAGSALRRGRLADARAQMPQFAASLAFMDQYRGWRLMDLGSMAPHSEALVLNSGFGLTFCRVTSDVTRGHYPSNMSSLRRVMPRFDPEEGQEI